MNKTPKLNKCKGCLFYFSSKNDPKKTEIDYTIKSLKQFLKDSDFSQLYYNKEMKQDNKSYFFYISFNDRIKSKKITLSFLKSYLNSPFKYMYEFDINNFADYHIFDFKKKIKYALNIKKLLNINILIKRNETR